MNLSHKKGYDAEAVSFRFVSKGKYSVQGRPIMGTGDSPEKATTYGKYLLLKELGRGGMGTVYLAEDTSLGRIVALKVLLPALSADDSFIRRFREEARSVAAVSHPNIVRIHSLDYIDSQYVIDMEYLDGGSLSDLMLREVMTPPRLLHVLSGIIHALAACHQCGIVHRDMKPQNVLVEQNGRVVLTDFGISTAYADHITKAMRRNSSCSFFVGTPRYAPPEAWDNSPAGPSWDVYSLGMVIFESLTGNVLYDGASPLEIARKMFLEPMEDISGRLVNVSEELAQLLQEMLSLDPGHRPKDGVELLARLQEVPEWKGLGPLTEETMTYTATDAMRRIRNKKRKERMRKYVGIAFAAVAAIVTLPLLGWGAFWMTQNFLTEVAGPAPQVAAWEEASVSPAIIFQGVTLQENNATSQPTTWYLRDRTQPNEREGLVFSKDALWGIEVLGGDDEDFTVAGFAADYRFGGGQGYREARITGTGRPLGRNTHAFNLQFECIASGERWDWTGTLAAHGTLNDDAGFRHALQTADGPQALLFRELIPRRRPWAQMALEGLYPRYERAYEVPIIELPQEADPYETLQAGVWRQQRFTTSGRVRSIPAVGGAQRARLQAVATEHGLHLQIDCPISPEASPFIHISVVPLMAYPVSASPQYVATLGPEGLENAHVYVQGVEQPWHCPWQGKKARNGDQLQAEVYIPSLGMRGAPIPGENVYWFLNVSISEERFPLEESALAYWGGPDLHNLSSSLLLRYTRSVQPAENENGL